MQFFISGAFRGCLGLSCFLQLLQRNLFFLLHHCPGGVPTAQPLPSLWLFKLYFLSTKGVGRILHPFFRSDVLNTRRQAPQPLLHSCISQAVSLQCFTRQRPHLSCLCSEGFQVTDHSRCSPFACLHWGYVFSCVVLPSPKETVLNLLWIGWESFLTRSQVRPARPAFVFFLQQAVLTRVQLAISSIFQDHFPDKRHLSSFLILLLRSATYPPTCACRGCRLLRGDTAAKLGRGPCPGRPAPAACSWPQKDMQRAPGSSCCCSIPQGRAGRQGSSSLPSHVRSLGSEAGGTCPWASVGPFLACNVRQCPGARAGRSMPWTQGFCRSQQAVTASTAASRSSRSPSRVPGSLFLPVNKMRTSQVRMQQHKRRQTYSVLILTSNFMSTSNFSYWWCLSTCRAVA